MAAIGFGLPKDAFTSLMKQVIQMVNSYSCLITCVSLSVSNSLMLVYFFKVKVDGNKERIVACDFLNDMMTHLLKNIFLLSVGKCILLKFCVMG